MCWFFTAGICHIIIHLCEGCDHCHNLAFRHRTGRRSGSFWVSKEQNEVRVQVTAARGYMYNKYIDIFDRYRNGTVRYGTVWNSVTM